MAVEDLKSKGQKLIEDVKAELGTVRTNRPHGGLVEDIKVMYYEKPTPIKSLGLVSIAPPREIVIEVWDPSIVPSIVKSIETLGQGLGVQSDGTKVRVFLPELSRERRDELLKYAKKITENYKIQVRHLRDEAIKELERKCENKEIREDDKFKGKELVQKEVDRVNGEIEKALLVKTKEIVE